MRKAKKAAAPKPKNPLALAAEESGDDSDDSDEEGVEDKGKKEESDDEEARDDVRPPPATDAKAESSTAAAPTEADERARRKAEKAAKRDARRDERKAKRKAEREAAAAKAKAEEERRAARERRAEETEAGDDTEVDRILSSPKDEEGGDEDEEEGEEMRVDNEDDEEAEDAEADDAEVPDLPDRLSPPPLEPFPLPRMAPAPDAAVLSRQGMPTGLQDATFIDQDLRMGLDTLSADLKAATPSGPGLSERTQKRLAEIGVEDLFAVQAAMLPHLLSLPLVPLPHAQLSDYLISAPTGSGKTLAYAIPIVELLARRVVPRLRALIVLPTRDLVVQVRETLETLAKGTGLMVSY